MTEGSTEELQEDRLKLPPSLKVAFQDQVPARGTGFVVKSNHTIARAQYSSGPIGCLVWQDVMGLRPDR